MNKFFTQAESNARGVRTHEEVGRDGDGNPVGRIMVGFSSTEERLGIVGGQIVQVAKEVTRPADLIPYGIGDLIAGTQTKPYKLENIARVAGGNGTIIGARLVTNKKGIVAAIRVHLYTTENVALPADNLPHKGLYADAAKRIATFDFPAMISLLDLTGDMSEAVNFNLKIPFICEAGSRDIYFALETQSIFTPSSAQKFYLFLFADVN